MTDGSPLALSGNWLSYHVFCERERLRVLNNFVLPLLRGLFGTGELESFFFIHYPEGGLHFRLRLLPRASSARTVAASVWEAAGAYTGDDGEPAHLQILEVPFELETERYGGQQLLPHSLEFFCVSSVVALEFFLSHGFQPRSRQLSRSFRLLGQQALGLANCVDEFLSLAGYMSFRWDEDSDGSAARGDRVFEQRPQDFLAAMGDLVRSFNQSSIPSRSDGCAITFTGAASLLSAATDAAALNVRRSIGISQMHMTSNRLALDNHEESYLARLLWRAARELAESDQDRWQGLQARYDMQCADERLVLPWTEVRQQYLGRLSNGTELRE